MGLWDNINTFGNMREVYTLCTSDPIRCHIMCMDWLMSADTLQLQSLWNLTLSFAEHTDKDRECFLQQILLYYKAYEKEKHASNHSTSETTPASEITSMREVVARFDRSSFNLFYASQPWNPLCLN